MKKKDNLADTHKPNRRPVARNRGGGPSTVMRVPRKMADMVLAFIDIMADFQNRPIDGQPITLPPSKTTDLQRRKLCSLMEKMVCFEIERQQKLQKEASDKRQYNLFEEQEGEDSAMASDVSGHYVMTKEHLLTVNERHFAYVYSLRKLGLTFWNRMSPNISTGDTVYLLVQTYRGNILFKTVVKGVESAGDSYLEYCKGPQILPQDVYILKYQGHYQGEKASRDVFDEQGLSRYSKHRILTKNQGRWLSGLIDCSDHGAI